MSDDMAFELKPEHVTLLRQAYVSWDGGEYGAPAIDCKRPYGNSDGAADVCRALGWETFVTCPRCGDEYSNEQLAKADTLHKETQTALQIVLTTGSFEPGVYRKRDRYDRRSWERAAP